MVTDTLFIDEIVVQKCIPMNGKENGKMSTYKNGHSGMADFFFLDYVD